MIRTTPEGWNLLKLFGVILPMVIGARLLLSEYQWAQVSLFLAIAWVGGTFYILRKSMKDITNFQFWMIAIPMTILIVVRIVILYQAGR